MARLGKNVTSEISIAISVPVHSWTPQFKAVLGSLKAQSVKLQIAIMMTHYDPRIRADLDNSGLSVHYSRVSPDAGQAAAIAEGWANTDSPILGWLNTDDALATGALTDVATVFEDNPDIDLVYGHSTVSDEKNAIRGYHPAVQTRLGFRGPILFLNLRVFAAGAPLMRSAE